MLLIASLASALLTVATAATPAARTRDGYVDDSVCSRCHAEKARTFSHVGMGRSFYRPSRSVIVEELGQPFVHRASNEVFELVWRDDRLVFRRYQKGPAGTVRHLLEQPIDWILGSGNHARVYLYRTPDGELFQLPIAWYAETKSLGMAPGYDRPDHDGVTRRVRYECMFCHNAYPDVAPSTSGYWRAQTYPKELPEGIGCQRCHGGGAEHVAAMVSGGDGGETYIVNPAKLAAQASADVCSQCHLLPAVSVQGARRFGRDVFSFRPGEALSKYVVPTDVSERGRPDHDRFEIDHQVYRLRQSRCYLESGKRVSCTQCHDPHRIAAPPERIARVRSVCAGCHEKTFCSGQKSSPGGRETADCASCHMPRRRAEDVVHVVMTDHRIGLPVGGDLVRPLQEKAPAIESVRLYDPSTAPPDPLGRLYRVAPVLRGGFDTDRALVDAFEQTLAAANTNEIEPLFDLANAQARLNDWKKLERTARQILECDPEEPQALAWLAIARGHAGSTREAIQLMRRAIERQPERAGLHVQLASLLLNVGLETQALTELETAVALRPNLTAAYIEAGALHVRRQEWNAAIDAYTRALEIEPRNEAATGGLERAVAASR
jgi:predicted CXXCH cytochrome family protein